MILPLARQGGVNSLPGVHLQEHSGDRSLWSIAMDQNLKESADNGLQNRRHQVLAWQPGADEGSPSSIESVAVGDLVYSATDVSLPPFQKLRGGATHLTDLTPFSEDEDALDPTQDGSPISHSRRRKQAGYSLAHLNASTNINDVTPDELSMQSEDYSFHRVKLLCSYGGKILPRPTDNQLRYVGGDTRLITVSRDIDFHELMQKMAELYALARTIKYKLPEEDLDALVSVSSNEDVANMMEEYDRLQSSDASPRLRLFLFSDVDHESVHLAEPLCDQRSSEQRYVDAVNGISESGPKKFSGDSGSLAVAPVVVDSLIDVGDSWGFIRQQEAVPVAMLAPQISLDVASLIQHVPVALPVSSIPPVSAPSSTPSSPHLVSRVLKQGLIPEMRLSFHSDQHSNVSGHQYNIVQADGTVLEGDSYGVNVPTSTIVHEQGYSNSDLQRGLESPRKLHHEGDALCVHQDTVAHDDIRRLPEVRMPQGPSHCKLTRLSDHLSESASSTRQRHGYQQPQLSQQYGGWQPHLFEEQTHVYSRRVELVQSTSDAVVQPTAPGKPAQPPHFRSPFQNVSAAPTIDQPTYSPADHQSQGEEVFAPFMPRSVSTNTIGPLGSTAVSSFNVAAGSAPSSPRVNYRDPLNVHASGQPQSQFFRSYAAPNHADQQQGLRHHAHSDCATRLGPATSPPRYRDHLGQTDGFPVRPLQQSAVATADALQLELFLYDGHNRAHGQCSEEAAMVQVPEYHGLNPFQDGPSRFSESSPSETQDGGDGRRHREKISHQSFLPLRFNARENFQDQSISSAEPHSRYEENPMDWVVHQLSRDADEIKSWRGGRVLTGQNGQVNEGGGADLEAPGRSFLHLPEDSEDLLVISDSYRRRTTDVVEPVSANNQHSRSILTQSHVFPIYPSTLGQASVLDMPQVLPYVVREIDPDFLAESVPRSDVGMPDLESTSALIEVSHLHSEVLSNELASQTDMDDKAATGAFNDSLPHLSTASSTRLEDTVLAKTAELRWGRLDDVNESRTDLQARDRSSILDQFQKFPGSGVTQGRLSSSSSGSRIELSEEVASQRLENSLTVTQGNGLLAEEENGSTAYGFHNLILNDVMPPFSVSKGQAQVVQPMTTRVTSFTIPALSITVSTELSIPSMPSMSANTCISVGTSITEQEANSMGSLLVKPGSTTSRISQADISGVLGQNADYRKDNKVLNSQIFATGHLAEDMASSVLVNSMRELPAPLPSANNMQVEDKGKRLSFSQDATAVIPANLIHAPTFSAPNWDSLQNLTTVNAEIDDTDICTPVASAENDDMDSQPPAIIDEELTSTEVRLEEFVELVTDAAVPIHEDLKPSFSDPDSAEDAEAEAIRSGLQTILNADLEEMRELGSGTFGTVYHGKWRGTDVAIKRIKSSCFAGRPAERDRLIADFWREACTLSQLHHPNVVAFYGVVRDGPGGTLATVTEYMVNGSLKQVLQKKDRTIDRRKRLLIAMDAAFGMEYLHSKNIVHFDLKCDNLLVNMRDPHRPICKVGDLGLSKVKHQTMVSGGVRGTLPWMAPELLNGSSTLVTEKVDVFSFGIVMWELLTGEEPYASMHYGAIIGGIVNNTLRPSIPTWCDPLWKSLMEKCWSAEPTCRPSFSEVASELRVMATALQPKAHVNAEIR